MWVAQGSQLIAVDRELGAVKESVPVELWLRGTFFGVASDEGSELVEDPIEVFLGDR